MGFGGFLAGFGEELGKYNMEQEVEKAKRRQALWENELDIAKQLMSSADPEVAKEGQARHQILSSTPDASKAVKLINESFGGVPLGQRIQQANVRRQQEAEAKKTEWSKQQAARVQPIMEQMWKPLAPPPSAGAFGAVAQVPELLQRAGTAERQFQELPRRPAELDRPAYQERYVPGRGLEPTPEYEIGVKEYLAQRESDIRNQSELGLMGAKNRLAFEHQQELSRYVTEHQQELGLSDQDLAYANYAIMTGQRHPGEDSNKFYLTPPVLAQSGPYAGKMVRMAVINGIGHPELVYPTGGEGGWSEVIQPNPTTGALEKHMVYRGVAGGAPAAGTTPGPGPSPRPTGGGKAAAKGNLRGFVEQNAPRYGYTGTVGALFNQLDQEQPVDSNSEEGVVREAARALATGQDTRGFRPVAVQRARALLQANGLVPLSTKEAETLDSTYTLLTQLKDMTQMIAQTRAMGPLNWESLQRSEIAGSTFEALKSLLSKRAFAEAGMLTNQDIKRAGRLLPWGVGGVSLEQFIPGPMGENAIIGLIQLRKFLEQALKKVYERKHGKRAASMEGDSIPMTEQGNLPDIPWEQNGSPDPAAMPLPETYWSQLKREAEAEMRQAYKSTGKTPKEQKKPEMISAHQPQSQQGIQDIQVQDFVDRMLGKKKTSAMMPAH